MCQFFKIGEIDVIKFSIRQFEYFIKNAIAF